MQLFRRSLVRATLPGALQLAALSVLVGQQSAVPPIRQLGPRLAITRDTLGAVSGVRQLSDGRVIVNDIGRHALLLYDPSLANATIIIDTTSTTKRAYGAATGGIIAYRADTTLFVDPIALSMLVIDPHGVIVRTVAPPRPSDASTLVVPVGGAGLDAKGRIVYRGIRAGCQAGRGCIVVGSSSAPSASGAAAATLPIYALHDSVAILRGDIATHVIDTVGFIAIPYTVRTKYMSNPDGSSTLTLSQPNPLPIADEWAVVSDGSVAFIRGQDYHVDWVNTDGTRTSTPKIAHDWHRLSDEEKQVILDSLKRRADSVAKVGLERMARADSIAKSKGQPPAPRTNTVYVWPEVADLPDYRPVFAAATFTSDVTADADDDLWIRQGASNYVLPGAGGPPVYDIVNREGRLTDRVQLPPSLTLAGFGPGVVYLSSREGTGTVIVKYRIR